MKKITPKQLLRRLEREKIRILDVRNDEKFEIGKLRHPNAECINVFKEEIFQLEEADGQGQLPFTEEQEVIITCTSGNSATRCTKILANKGYNVTLLDGGMVNWNKENN